MTDVRLAPASEIADHDSVSSLRQWLQGEDAFRGRVRAEGRALVPNEMGGAADVLVVAVSSGGALTVLVNSVSTWLRQRRSRYAVEIQRVDGTVIRVTAEGPAADASAAAFDFPSG